MVKEMTLREFCRLSGKPWEQELQRMYREGAWTNGASLSELRSYGPDRLHGPVEVTESNPATSGADDGLDDIFHGDWLNSL